MYTRPFSLFVMLITTSAADTGLAGAVEPAPPKAAAVLADADNLLSPSAVHIDGWLGPRIDANESKRLLVVDTGPLLAGYHKKPGSHPWIGEHVGKWMHAATLAWAYSGDQRLRKKLDRIAAELIQCQEPDGYLGTYVPAQRFGQFPDADWDVWSHKYNLIGLMTYYQYTGDKAALDACRKMADLLITTFPAKKSILAAGTHMGMAATSVLEPIVLLYRATGDQRYLQFARYIVKSWNEPNGPRIVDSLLTVKRVDKTANGKAYEMLSNIVGLCELARATGDRKLLQAAKNAWQDIVDNRLYVTGSASSFEVFHKDHELPNSANNNICETCVTTTWIQLNLQLLRITGEAKYGDELERSFYNHLAAAQHPRGDDWCYYTALEGRKPYDKGITCCHSSGPRGMALAPQAAYLRGRGADGDVLVVSTLETSRATLELGGQKVMVEQKSDFPRGG
ncbi:MAG: beta-L-arabinofuranosidase domain-containing protein, partial [Thermoguttaceae bacterium]